MSTKNMVAIGVIIRALASGEVGSRKLGVQPKAPKIQTIQPGTVFAAEADEPMVDSQETEYAYYKRTGVARDATASKQTLEEYEGQKLEGDSLARANAAAEQAARIAAREAAAKRDEEERQKKAAAAASSADKGKTAPKGKGKTTKPADVEADAGTQTGDNGSASGDQGGSAPADDEDDDGI